MKKASEVEGDLILGGLMMIHEREDDITCGPVMPQGGIQVIILFVSLLKYHKKLIFQ